MTALDEFRQRATSLRQANEEVANNVGILLAYERQSNATLVELHSALRNFAESAQTARRSMSALCEVLAVDPEKLDGPLDDLVPPLFEHVD